MADRLRRIPFGDLAFAFLAGMRLFVGVAYRPSFFLTLVFDDGAYIGRAAMLASGHWATEFTDKTFLRGPFYSLYLAFVARSGLPLGLVDAATEILAIAWLASETSKLVTGSRRWAGVIGCALLIVPTAVTTTGVHIIRDSLSNTLVIAGCAAAIRVVRCERHLLLSVLALGSIVGALFITREDAVWCLPPLVAVAAYVVVRGVRARRYADIFTLIALVAAVAVPSILVREANRRSGLDATTIFTDADFKAAHNALTRYASDGSSGPLALTSTIFDSLVERSPDLARIAPGMTEWRDTSGTIDSDALQFSIVRGLSLAGVLSDQDERSALLGNVAEDVAALCEIDRRPACHARAGPPPVPVYALGDIVDAGFGTFQGLEQLFLVEGPPPATTGSPGPVARFLQYAAITNTTPPPGSYSIQGEEVTFGERPTTVATAVAAAWLAIGRTLVPIVRVVGMVAVGWLLVTRRWRFALVCLTLLLAAWARAAQVTFAARIGIAPYDFHYAQLAATLLHVAAVVAIAAVVGLRRTSPETAGDEQLDPPVPAQNEETSPDPTGAASCGGVDADGQTVEKVEAAGAAEGHEKRRATDDGDPTSVLTK